MPFLSDMVEISKMAEKVIMENNIDHGGMAEAPSTPLVYQTAEPQRWSLKIGKDGRLVIPTVARALMELGEDGQVIAHVKDGELHIISQSAAIRRVQAYVKLHRKGTGSMVDELISERREAAARGD
jgi:bifunctional DNA-binding transcriptional regulator/antitoxin component of YhaV-PrlF toxin-antitoxin module